MAAYPDYIDGKPPVVTLQQYDLADWNPTTSVDRIDGKYVVVETLNPTKIIANLADSDTPILNQIFQSAHADYAKQIAEEKRSK